MYQDEPTFLGTDTEQFEELSLYFRIELNNLTPSCDILVTCVQLKNK